jgi:prenylcysteine oxidase/farnesylcysteine lyase
MVNLAIVGSGIGGCSAAYFARKYLPDSKITLYDVRDRIGGRILTNKEGSLNRELGASFFNAANFTIYELVRERGLSIKKIEESKDFAIWNGSEILFNSNPKEILTLLKLISRYKLSLPKMILVHNEAKRKIVDLYKEEKANPTELETLFELVGLDKWYRKPFDESLIKMGISKGFIDDIITPITRILYSQNADLGGFAGLASIIGVYGGPIYRLTEGNSVLPRSLVEASDSELKLGRKVESIEKTSDGSYRVSGGEEALIFDGVIIAVPLEMADIDFEDVSIPEWEPQQYQRVYLRVMQGFVDYSYFGLVGSKVPAKILTTAEADPITHLTIQKSTKGESLLSIASIEPLENDVLGEIFEDGETVLEHDWSAAYPIFKPIERLPPTRLDERLMYVNSIDSAASSLESSAFAALNVIKLLRDDLK